MKKLLLVLAVAPLMAAGSTSINWMDDYSKAQEMAKKENKLMLLFFQGSDWCGPCKRLKKEVFSQPEFAQKVGNDFIFVAVDFPMDKSKQSEEIRKQNKELQKKFAVTAYPTLVIVNPQGNRVGTLGYGGQSPSQFADRLKSMVSDVRDEVMAEGQELARADSASLFF